MAERSFVECTTSALTGLLEFNKHYTYRAQDIAYVPPSLLPLPSLPPPVVIR